MSKKELYDIVVEEIGEILVIPPIEYCFMIKDEVNLLGFNCGNTLIVYSVGKTKHSVSLIDELNFRSVASKNVFKEMFSE